MTPARQALVGAEIFDGVTRHRDHALILDGERVEGVVHQGALPGQVPVTQFDGGLLAPGFVDLQVNGGGGVMFNDEQTVPVLRQIAEAHARLGTTALLPTLITDDRTRTEAAIGAVEDAIRDRVPGIVGLHLEGPHLSIARKGAHDPTLIRAMDPGDLDLLCDAAKRLPTLKITVAAETVAPDQITALCDAGVLVSLGHSDADYETCKAAADAGASCVTHLFNAMSQLTNREPGLVGAALALGNLSAGMIADGIHVHPATMAMALAAKQGPGQIFLVSDAMALAGSDAQGFTLNDRPIKRGNGRLTLEDGTLAGADLDLLQAIRNLTRWGLVPEDTALAMASTVPAGLCGQSGRFGVLAPGAQADIVHITPGADRCHAVWQSGDRIV